MSKVVVTGGLGFIGSHLVRSLVVQGNDVHSIDTAEVPPIAERLVGGATYHQGDVCDTAFLTSVFEGAEFVFHTAALPRVQFSLEHPEESNAVNVSGTLAVLEAARKAGVKRVVFTSSGSVYGEPDELPIHEGMAAAPKSPYAQQKHIGELYCRLYSDVYGLSTVCLRPFNVYGPHADPHGAYALVVGKFIEKRRQNQPLTIWGSGENTRDYVHMYDLIRAYELAAVSPSVGKGEAINIASGRPISVNEIAELIGGMIEREEARLEPKNAHANIKRAEELLGWTPAISFEEGIAELKREAGLL